MMNNWHYQRPELARRILKTFEVGITSHVALIAPRRKGKTLFLLNDLASEAIRDDYVPIYASLWQNMDAPHEGIISSLEEAIDSVSNKSSLKKLFNSKIRKASISNELIGKVDVEFADRPKRAAPKELILIDNLINRLGELSKKKTLLLFVDEVQHLATGDEFNPLAHGLRTALDKRQGEVKSVFTGSSRRYMNLLFNEETSAFYHFAEQMPFPDLDIGFIEFIRLRLHDDYSLSLSKQSLYKAFEQFDKSPYWMMKMVSHLITYDRVLKNAIKYVATMMEESEGFSELAKMMKPIDIILFNTISGGKSPFSEDVLKKVANETNLKGIAGNVQRSIERLKGWNVISQTAPRVYNVEKPGLKKYLDKDSVTLPN